MSAGITHKLGKHPPISHFTSSGGKEFCNDVYILLSIKFKFKFKQFKATFTYTVDFNKSLKNVNNIFLKEIENTAVLNLKIGTDNNQKQSESAFLTMAFIFQTDLLLSRSETSFLVASMYCDVARLFLCSLLIDSFINSPLPCPARVAACSELMVRNGYFIHIYDVSIHFYFYRQDPTSFIVNK